MLSFRDVQLRRGRQILFDGLDLTLYAGQRVGITGPNGSGKSSLFELIRGTLAPDRGALDCPSGLTIAHVAQEIAASHASALEFVLGGDAELVELRTALATAEQADDGERLAQLHQRLDAVDGYTAESRAAQLLSGLGFSAARHHDPVASFSGGWRMRLNLGRALMCRSDLLLLDEPTNHLDLDTVYWLEQWLQRYPGTLLLISHDRDFLDTVVDHIGHVEARQLVLYPGNFAAFERQYAERLARQQALHEKQERERAHLQQFIDRFRAKATKARQAQSRIKALERMETVAAVQAYSPFRFEFPAPERAPHPLLQLDDCTAGYDPAAPVLQGINLSLEPGARIGLLGRNGAGKSTLIKLIAGQLEAHGGERRPAQGLQVAFFAQHQLESLDPEASPVQHIQRLTPSCSEQAARDFLGGFGFQGEQALARVAPFSGGEKSRLALALLVWQRPNLLLLDEPTNHLDLEMRDALSLALQSYTGAMVLVSHDRYLMRSTCDAWLLVTDGRVNGFEGDLEDYGQWLGQQRAGAGTSDPPPLPDPGTTRDRKAERRAAANQRAQLKPLRQRLARIERELEQMQREQVQLADQLADPAMYHADRKETLRATTSRKGQVDKQIAALEDEWLAVSEDLEANGLGV